MSAITLSDLSDILEKIIRPAVEDQLYAKTILWNMFGGYQADGQSKKDSMPKLNAGVLKTSLDNDAFYIPILTAHSSGAVAIAEGGSLVTGKPTTNQAKVSARYQTGTFQINKQTLSVKDAGVAVRQLDFFMKENAKAMVIDLNRQGYGDGSATIGTANAAGTSSTAFVFKASTNGDIDYTRFTPPGTSLKIGSNSAVTVSAITGKNAITLSSALTWAQGDAVKKTDGAGAVATELDGLAEAVSDTAVYQSIDPSTNPSWKAYVDSTSGALALADMDNAYLEANRTGDVKYIVMNKTLFRKYGGLLQGQIRFTPKDVLGGGWVGLDYMGGKAQIVLDYDCPDDRVYFLSPDSFTLAELSPFEWEKGTEGNLLRVQGTLNYEAVATWFGNLGNFQRSANAVLTARTG